MVQSRDEAIDSFRREMENGVKQVALSVLQEHKIDESELTPEELATIKELSFASGHNWSHVLARISTRVKLEKNPGPGIKRRQNRDRVSVISFTPGISSKPLESHGQVYIDTGHPFYPDYRD